MLFNSYVFIFAFLPLTLLAFHVLSSNGYFRLSIFSLVLASFVFYAWWSPLFLLLFLVLILLNFSFGKLIHHYRTTRPRSSKAVFVAGLIVNVGVLCYFKYTNFVLDNLNSLLGTNLEFYRLVLPLGISFFTFQKVAFLVDVYQGKTTKFNLLDFLLFVMFFPQLIAGPIVHHREVMPQFAEKRACASMDSARE